MARPTPRTARSFARWPRSVAPALYRSRSLVLTFPHGRGSRGIRQLDLQSLVRLPLRTRSDDVQRTDLPRVLDMCSAIRLQVEPDDLDRPHLGDRLRQQIDLRPDQIGDLECFVARQDSHEHVPTRAQLLIGSPFDLRYPLRSKV